jgi:hypothetical protein
MTRTQTIQDPPNSVQVEATEGCNLRCGFCGIRGIRESGDRDNLSGPYRYMTPGTAGMIADDIVDAGWNPRIEFAMHGEPTMNPDLPRLVSTFRELGRWPVLVTTNGIPLLDGWRSRVADLYDAGTSTIAVDNYRPYRCEEAVLGTSLPGVTVHRYPQDGPAANPHRRPRKGERRLVLVQDISQADTGNHSHLSNHAGSAGELDHSRDGERCALPFREISVRWDGNVALCCNDWRGVYKIGSVKRIRLSGLWQGEEFQAARRRLYAGQRDYAPCHGCTHRTYRNGLLPDRTGKNTMEEPRTGDEAVIQDALAGEPFTAPVRRKWELPVVEVKHR